MSEALGHDDLEGYEPGEFPPFAVTVDVVVFTIRDEHLQVVLIQRGEPPFEGRWSLPGGFVRPDEDLDAAARRELAEETGVVSGPAHLEQLGSYGDPDRDPRMRVVTVAYWAIIPSLADPVAGSDASYADLVKVDSVLRRHVELAFDHEQIVRDALEALRQKLEDTTLASTFWADDFRISDLRRVYELVWGYELDPGNFQRKVRKIPDWLEPTGEKSDPAEGGRPAELYRSRRGVHRLSMPVRRSVEPAKRRRRSRPDQDG